MLPNPVQHENMQEYVETMYNMCADSIEAKLTARSGWCFYTKQACSCRGSVITRNGYTQLIAVPLWLASVSEHIPARESSAYAANSELS